MSRILFLFITIVIEFVTVFHLVWACGTQKVFDSGRRPGVPSPGIPSPCKVSLAPAHRHWHSSLVAFPSILTLVVPYIGVSVLPGGNLTAPAQPAAVPVLGELFLFTLEAVYLALSILELFLLLFVTSPAIQPLLWHGLGLNLLVVAGLKLCPRYLLLLLGGGPRREGELVSYVTGDGVPPSLAFISSARCRSSFVIPRLSLALALVFSVGASTSCSFPLLFHGHFLFELVRIAWPPGFIDSAVGYGVKVAIRHHQVIVLSDSLDLISGVHPLL